MMGKMEIRSTPPGSRPRDGRHCDLCGCSQPAVRCDKCGCQIFCLSCDDMYHRHPKRRFHLRKAVDPIPPVPQARPNLPMKVSHLNTSNPGDPSKMPLPPPRKKKSLFGSFRKPSPSGDNSPPLPKKEYSWTDRLGSIKKFMSNRPLPPLPNADDNDMDSEPTTNGQSLQGDLSFIHKRIDERPPQLPQRSPRSPDFPGVNQEKENRIPSTPPPVPGQVRNGSVDANSNHMNHEFPNSDENHWNNHLNHQNGPQAFGTMNRQMHQRGFMPPGAPGYPGGMHQSSSATDLHRMHSAEGMPGAGPVPPHYPHYPMNPHMPPHYPYPMYPQYPANYPPYIGNSFASMSNPPTSEGDQSDSESTSRHSSKKHPFRKRAKRSQSVMVDRMAYPGQFFPFGPYPGYGPWGAPMPMEAPPSPASSVRSLNRAGRTRRRKKMTSEDDDDLSGTSSPMSRPKSSSSDPKEHSRAPLATQTTSSEDESDDDDGKRRNKVNTIKRPPETNRLPSPVAESKRVTRLKKSFSKHSDSDTQESPEIRNDRRPSDPTTEQRSSRQSHQPQQSPVRSSPLTRQSPVRQSPVSQSPVRQSPVRQSPTPQQHFRPQQPSPSASKQPHQAMPDTWECKHCTYVNPNSNRICQVCCKTFTPRSETPVTAPSRESSSAASNRKESVGSEMECSSPDKSAEPEDRRKDKQDMASLNSALDEAEKQISKGLEELMKLKDDIDANMSKDNKSKPSENQSRSEAQEGSKPVYKSSGKMRTSILDKLSLNKPQTTNASVSTSTETQTGQSDRRPDRIIEARRHSNSSSASENYNSPLAQSPEFDRAYLGNKQKRDSSCQTQQDSLAEYLEKRKSSEEAFLGRPINNFGFGYADRMDMVTSPVPAMYDRFFGGGYGLMQRSHSRASLFTGRINDLGPMDYGPGFGYGPTPMYRSVSRGSLTGDYPDGRLSEFHNLRKPDYYLSMEELVERRRQDNIRAQGLELVRMIREAEQQGFNADDIQVALTHCGKQNPMEWLQENWRNMVDSVMTLSTNYGNDKKENDIGLLSENEAREALRLHKGNIWAAVTECVEGRQRKYLELSARGNFSRQDIVDALTSSEGDVEMAYAKMTKSTGKPFLMRIWGQGEGAQNQDGAQPIAEDFNNDGPRRYLKDETLNSDEFSEELWSDDGDGVDWDEEEEYDEEERGDIEDLRTCQEDLQTSPQEMMTPESEKSDYCDAFSLDDRNASSPSDDIFFVIPEAKPEKKKGFLSKLAALRKDSKEQADSMPDAGSSPPVQPSQSKEDAVSQKSNSSSEQPKNGGAFSALKNTLNVIKDTVTGGAKYDKKMPCAQPERRTIIVHGQTDHEPPDSPDSKTSIKLTSFKPIDADNSVTSIPESQSNDKNKYEENVLLKKEVESGKDKNDKTIKTNQKEKEKTQANTDNLYEHSELKKPENKKSQSLAEKIKFAKQTRSSADAPGPSGIDKDNSFTSDVPGLSNVNRNYSSPVPGPSGIKKDNFSLETNVRQSIQAESQENKLLQNQESSYPKNVKEKETNMSEKNINELPKSQNKEKNQPERAFANVIQKNKLLRQKSVGGEVDTQNEGQSILASEDSSASPIKYESDKPISVASTKSPRSEPNLEEETEKLPKTKAKISTADETDAPPKLNLSNEIRESKSSPIPLNKDSKSVSPNLKDVAVNDVAGSSKPMSGSLHESVSAITKEASREQEGLDIGKTNLQAKSADISEAKSVHESSKKKIASEKASDKVESKADKSSHLPNASQKIAKQEKNEKGISNTISEAPRKTVTNEDIKTKLSEQLENVKSCEKSEKLAAQESKSVKLIKGETCSLSKNNEDLSKNTSSLHPSVSEIKSDGNNAKKTNTPTELIKSTQEIISECDEYLDKKLTDLRSTENAIGSIEVVSVGKDLSNKTDNLSEPNAQTENGSANQLKEQNSYHLKQSDQPAVTQKNNAEHPIPINNSENALNSKEIFKTETISELPASDKTTEGQNSASTIEKKELILNAQLEEISTTSKNDSKALQVKDSNAKSSQHEVNISETAIEPKDSEVGKSTTPLMIIENNKDTASLLIEKENKAKDDSMKTSVDISELKEKASQEVHVTENITKAEPSPSTTSHVDSSNAASTSKVNAETLESNLKTETSLNNEMNVEQKESASTVIEDALSNKEATKPLDSTSENANFNLNNREKGIHKENKIHDSVDKSKSSSLEKSPENASKSSNNTEAFTQFSSSVPTADTALASTSKDDQLSNAKQSEEKSNLKQIPYEQSETSQNSTEKTIIKGADENDLQPPVFSKEFPDSKNNAKTDIPAPLDVTKTSNIVEVSPTTNTTDSAETTSTVKSGPEDSKNSDASVKTPKEETTISSSSNENKTSIDSAESIATTSADIKTTVSSSNISIDPPNKTASSSTSMQSDIITTDSSKSSASDKSTASLSSSNVPGTSEEATSNSSSVVEGSSKTVTNSSSDIPKPDTDKTDTVTVDAVSQEQIEQHSNPENTVDADSSSMNSEVESPKNAVSTSQSNKLQRTVSEDNSEPRSLESDDTDTEYSDNSFSGIVPPSPVDALRSRFEGLAGNRTVRGGPIRPASPFRRMSFNSRKQVIALEKKRDTSGDKPWMMKKIVAEPVKITHPKRSIKQQLEMERKVRKMVSDRKCRTYRKAEIVVQLMDMNFEEEESIQAANECSTLEQAISYLQQECLLCTGHFAVSQIVSMTHCEHKACRECIRAYFTVQIRDRTILDLLCPFCNEPDISDEDVAQDYFNHLDIMLKKLVDVEIHELFQRKLRDRVLMKDPNFRWCSQCSSGFIAMPNLTRLICPDCNAVTCASCRRLWEREHQGISCEAFAALKDASDPEAQAAGLAKMLTEDGISCPSCHFRYALAKGGCMHFRCIQCQHDFCSGCSRPFKMGQKCGVSEFCAKLGLHAHHPRNCLFYLRDKDPEDLQKLLDMNDVKYNKETPDGMELRSTCQVMEQKETADGMMDDYCGKDVQEGYAGLCRIHYVEYLGQLVNKNQVDPIQIFDNDDLELVLRRANIRLPPKRYRESDAQYRDKLINVIQEELPLDKMDGS